MSNPDRPAKRRAMPVSIRFTDAEKADLRKKATGVPLGTFIRSIVLGEGADGRISKRQDRIQDREALGQLLGLLGKSRLANNLNQLAKAVNTGSLPVTDETEAELRRACADVAEMRGLLLLTLGVRSANDENPTRPLSDTFARVARPAP